MTYLAALFAHYAPYAWFAAVWTIPIAALGAVGFVSLDRAGMCLAELRRPSTPVPTPLLWVTVSAVAFAAFISAYSYLIVYHEDLVGLDYATITAARFVVVPIWPWNGRFFPLALQEFNLLAILGRSATVYHGFAVLELLLVLACVFRLLDDTPAWFGCAVATFMVVLPGVFVSFFGLVYPERDIVFWLALWMLCIRAFDRTRSRAAFIAALVTSQFLLYYKETAFILIGGFAVVRLVADWFRGRDGVNRRAAALVRDNLLEISHLALCAVFLTVYVVVVARHVTESYAMNAGAPSSWLESIATYAKSDYLLDAFVIVVAGRLSWFAIMRRALDSFWDPLAIGALCYGFAFVKLGMTREYYQAPVEFVGAMYVARLAYAGLRIGRPLVIALSLLVVGLLFQRNVSDAASRLLARKQYVEGNVRLASFLKDYSRSHGRTRLELYFPQVGGFELMELSAFLQYKGLRSAGDSIIGSPGSPGFIVKTAHRYPDDLCYPAQAFRCMHAPAPTRGDLLVFLSGRAIPAAQLEALKASTVEVFHFRPEAGRIERALDALAPAERKAERIADVRVFEYGEDLSVRQSGQ
ncbi:MAG TPA: hypothetical protein VFS57_02125 [Gemmatimonadaceae bacterium]|nr:hypothetical protein [Gemmatimonadaceae bacterium]